MSVVVPAKSRAAVSGSARREEFGVDEVEAGLAALDDKVARLQKDIGALKRADGSHREARVRPAKMTYARNVDDRPQEKKVTRFAEDTRGGDEDRREGEAREPEARSREPAPTTAATTTTTRQRKHALFNAQRKNRAQPQEVNCRADDDDAQRGARHPHASDLAPTPEEQRASTRKAVRKRISRGIQYDTQDCQVANYRISMKCSRVKRPEIKESSTKHRQAQRPETSGGSEARRDGARAIDGRKRGASAIRSTDEQTGADVLQRRRGSVATPSRQPNLDEASPADERLGRAADRGGPAQRSGDGKPVKGRGDAAASQKENDTARERTKKTILPADEKVSDRKTGQDAPKAQPSTSQKKAEDSANGSKKIKTRKVGKIDQDSSARTATNREISSKIIKLSKATVEKMKPDRKKFHSVFKKTPHESKQKSSKINSVKSSKSTVRENKNHKSQKQNTTKNSKSSDSIELKRIVIKDKLSNCTKELNQLLRKASGLFRKKSSKSKRVKGAL